jgi:hypothetical protein
MAFTGYQQEQRTPEEEAKLAAMFAPVEVRPNELKIKPGQNINDVRRLLKKDGVPFGDGGYSFVKGGIDDGYMNVDIDRVHLDLCVFYSRGRQTVTRMSAVMFTGQRYKAAERLDVKEVTLHKDGTYSIRFARPADPAPRPARSNSGQQTGKQNR